MQRLYELVNLRVIMLDIIIWEEDPIKLAGESSDTILESFKSWISKQKVDKSSGIPQDRIFNAIFVTFRYKPPNDSMGRHEGYRR